MSFYGNIANGNRFQYTFDKVYPNRATMEEALVKPNPETNLIGDGVFLVRYVLIEYDDNTFSRREGYMVNPPDNREQQYVIFLDPEFTVPFTLSEHGVTEGYGLVEGDIVYIQYGKKYAHFMRCLGIANEVGYALFQYITTDEYTPALQGSDYLLNFQIDRDWALAKGIQMQTGWDSTVWQKVIKEGKEAYIMIASLNSETPTFTVTAEAPTMEPIPPHFDVNSTNAQYALHLQPNWGFKVKEGEISERTNELLSDAKAQYSAIELNPETGEDELVTKEYDGAIYFNKAGFDKAVSAHSSEPNEINMLPTGISGKLYATHNADNPLDTTYEERPDIQELKMHIPALGNAISDMWDIIYGGPELNGVPERNLDIEWNSTQGLRLLPYDPDTNLFEYNTKNVETVAGCINSVHDLMGMIISLGPEPGQTPAEALELAQTGRIYYGALNEKDAERKGFFFKDTAYTYKSFDEMKEEDPTFDPETYVGSRLYYDLTQYKPNIYHTFRDNNFYWETSSERTPDTVYYLLGKPIKVRLLPWQEETEEEGEDGKPIIIKHYSYYEDDSGNYLVDMSSTPDPKKEYFTLALEQVTIPEPDAKKDEVLTLLWSPKNTYKTNLPVDYKVVDKNTAQELNISSFGEGYFYLETEEVEDPETGNVIVKNKALIGLKETDEFDESKRYFYVPQFAVATGQDATSINQIFYFIQRDGSVVSFTGAVTGNDNFDYQQFEMRFVPFEDDIFFKEIMSEDGKHFLGYKKIRTIYEVDASTIYYLTEKFPETGEVIIDPETGEPIYTHYYIPGLYYYISGEKDYILSTSSKLNDQLQYCFITNKDDEKVLRDEVSNLPLIDPEDVTFYEPGKYYYRSAFYDSDILDNSRIMKTPQDTEIVDGEEVFVVDQDYIEWIDRDEGRGLVYYTLQEAYVVDDSRGILVKGAVWDKNVVAPSTVTLGSREQIYVWTELEGFSKTLNTINGMLLQLNRYFKFNDEYTRDTNTIQGCLNSLKDLINTFDILNPGEIIIVDEYGRMTGSYFKETGWIESEISPKLNNGYIELRHKDPNGDAVTIGSATDTTLKFGDKFTSLTFGVDAKGHVFTDTAKNAEFTLPTLSFDSDTDTKQLITKLSVDDEGKFTVTRNNVGNLTLTGYALAGTAEAIADTDTVNDAFGKTQAQLNALQAAVNILNGDNTTAGSVAYQIAQIVNENNNGSIDTLNEIAGWIINDTTGAASMANDISALKLSATTLSGDVTTLKDLVGTTKVETQIADALTDTVKTSTKFSCGDSQKTIEELCAYIVSLETRIKTLEDASSATE